MRFRVINQNTDLGIDYQISTYLVQLMNGQTSAFVPVQIVNDNQPEFNESFVIQLEESSLTGGAKLGTPKECVVTILENDYPYGLIGIFSMHCYFYLSFDNMGECLFVCLFVCQLVFYRFIQFSLQCILVNYLNR